jgi:8-oxo-dGTP pyrophosphatase MutT (NUDIX family)
VFTELRAGLSSRRPADIVKPGVVETAVAVVLAPSAAGPEVLLIRRAESPVDPWSGHMGLPGGRREEEDADRLETALRETAEEVGLDLPRAALLGRLDDLNPAGATARELSVRPFVFALEGPEAAAARAAARARQEVASVHWTALSTLYASETRAEVEFRGGRREVSCFAGAFLPEGRVVWGLTYRILSALKPLL